VESVFDEAGDLLKTAGDRWLAGPDVAADMEGDVANGRSDELTDRQAVDALREKVDFAWLGRLQEDARLDIALHPGNSASGPPEPSEGLRERAGNLLTDVATGLYRCWNIALGAGWAGDRFHELCQTLTDALAVMRLALYGPSPRDARLLAVGLQQVTDAATVLLTYLGQSVPKEDSENVSEESQETARTIQEKRTGSEGQTMSW
jgi:hypothetical protein